MAFKVLTPTRKLQSVSIVHYARKGLLELSQQCVFWLLKKDENLFPLCTKLQTVVLGNHKDCVWSKNEWHAPVLCGNSLCFLVSMAVNACCPLCQGNYKTNFVKAFFPMKRWLLFALLLAILRPSPINTGFYAIPSMDSATAHNISIKNHQNTQVHRSHSFHQEPCLFTGFVMDPCDPSTPASSTPLTLGLYIDDFPTSWQTLWWRHSSIIYLLSAVRSTLWEWSSGFWASTSHSLSLRSPSQFILINWILQLTWSKDSL